MTDKEKRKKIAAYLAYTKTLSVLYELEAETGFDEEVSAAFDKVAKILHARAGGLVEAGVDFLKGDPSRLRKLGFDPFEVPSS